MKVTIIGLGLIGGSMALDIRRKHPDVVITGIDHSEGHARRALELGIVNKIETEDVAIGQADVVVLAIPVNAMAALLPQVLDLAGSGTVVIDAGSTKSQICRVIRSHPNRNNFVAAHPIAGTENSGPDAAFAGLFSGKTNIICEKELSSPDALKKAISFFDALEMKTIYMDPEDHDKHVAYVSHLSHVSSFLLGQTVLDIEKDEKNIFNLAGSGFASTVRLAKSSPDMWAPIFEQNAEYLGQALAEYIMHLQRFHYQLMKRNTNEIYRVMKDANKIRSVLEGLEVKTVPPIHETSNLK